MEKISKNPATATSKKNEKKCRWIKELAMQNAKLAISNEQSKEGATGADIKKDKWRHALLRGFGLFGFCF